ncbi:MAG TPA: efflux RND transporter permease subunit, partial [Acidobacteria bacterium]|nr:efflux RND transporter permease subunit [Acidobacteriota bacterium]
LQLIEMAPIFDQGKVIRESLDTLLQSGKIGALFAIAVLFFFLRRVRLTLIITLSIPLSILIAITVMYFAGETLNVLSLLGLMISVGLLVDNAVVVAENIHRLHSEGLPRRRAAIQGAAEIALAVTMATLTTIIVFLPVSLVKGQAQFFLLRLSIPISVSLLGSLAVAGIVVPLGVYLTLGGGGRGARTPWPPWERFTGAIAWLYDQSFGRLNEAYNRLLGVFLCHRLDLVVLLALVLAATAGIAFHKVKIVETQEEERSGFDVSVRLPQATTLDEAKVFFRSLEKIVAAHKAELDLSGYFVFHVATHGRIQGWFNNPRTKPKLTPRMATERLLELLPKKPGVTYLTGQQSERKSQSRRSQYTVTLYGQDPDRLEEAAKGVEELLVKVPGVLGLQSSGEPAPNELELVVDRQRAQELGVNPSVIAGLVGFSLRGQQLRYYRTKDREIPVRVRFREADRETLAQLRSFLVPAGEGFVSLDTLTSIRFGRGAKYIRRQDKRIARTITLELE